MGWRYISIWRRLSWRTCMMSVLTRRFWLNIFSLQKESQRSMCHKSGGKSKPLEMGPTRRISNQILISTIKEKLKAFQPLNRSSTKMARASCTYSTPRTSDEAKASPIMLTPQPTGWPA